MTDRESLFSVERLAALRDSNDRHAIALLDVAIEEVAAGRDDVAGLVRARENLLLRMVELARMCQEKDAAQRLVEAIRSVV